MEWKNYSNKIGGIQIFCKAAELESFSLAARALGLTPAAVSRSIARIEARLGIRLFFRSTRNIKLSDEGRLYFDHCTQALRQIENAEELISGNRCAPHGTLRISMPTTYGHCRVMPIIKKYRESYPDVSFEIDVSNRNIDFIEEGYDLAIRLGELKDSRLVARQLEIAQLGVYASPEYLRRKGTPTTLNNLAQHECIQFIMPSSGKALPWIFYDKCEEFIYTHQSKICFSGDVMGCASYAAAGGGLFQTYDFIASQKQYSNLQEVLKPYRGGHRMFSVLYQQNKVMPAKTRAFLDLLIEGCAAS